MMFIPRNLYVLTLALGNKYTPRYAETLDLVDSYFLFVLTYPRGP
jgi:hypothetical protein